MPPKSKRSERSKLVDRIGRQILERMGVPPEAAARIVVEHRTIKTLPDPGKDDGGEAG